MSINNLIQYTYQQVYEAQPAYESDAFITLLLSLDSMTKNNVPDYVRTGALDILTSFNNYLTAIDAPDVAQVQRFSAIVYALNNLTK